MADFITMSCPSCGGNLQIGDETFRYICDYCGNEHIVDRTEGVLTLLPIIEGLTNIQTSSDKVASELAIQRIKPEVDALKQQVKDLEKQWNENVHKLRENQRMYLAVNEYYLRNKSWAERLFSMRIRAFDYIEQLTPSEMANFAYFLNLNRKYPSCLSLVKSHIDIKEKRCLEEAHR